MGRFKAVSGACVDTGLSVPDDLLRDPTDAPSGGIDVDLGEIDDATTAYVLAMRPAFDLVRDGVTELGGLMVLAIVGARNEAAHDLLARIRYDQEVARQLIHQRAGTVPKRAAHHHYHLMQAGECLDRSLRAAAFGRARIDATSADAIMGPLKAAYRHLQWSTGALPGFEVVAFSRGCCRLHASQARAAA